MATARGATGMGGLLAAALAMAACGSGTPTAAPDSTSPDQTSTTASDVVTLVDDATCPTEGEEWEVAKLYIEHNATDDDTGVHGFFGGEAWRELCIWDPNGEQILFAEPRAQFKNLAVSDLFFESREPPADEYSVSELMADFPEGDYIVGGTDYEGTPRVGVAPFTHDIPVEPVITFPVLAAEAESAGESVVPAANLVVTWDPVGETLSGDTPSITGYEVIITTEEFEDPNGWSRPVYDVHVPPELNSLGVPAEFLQTDTVYELEVLALEESGNQTISVGFFTTAP